MKVDHEPSSLGLVVLGMLIDEPMHAYRMQKLLKLWGKDKVVNIRRPASIYQTLDRLVRLELVEVRETVQTESHPVRILYGITAKGRSTLKVWLRKLLTAVGGEFPDFPAAVSMLVLLTPEEGRASFVLRIDAVRAALKQIEEDKQAARDLPRLFLLEDAYRAAMLEAELVWLSAVISDLENRSLFWSESWLRSIAAQYGTLSENESTKHELDKETTHSEKQTKSQRDLSKSTKN